MNLGLTLLGEMLTFAIFVGFTMKYIWPALDKALEDRRKKIEDGLAAAEKSQHMLAATEEQVQSELRAAREKCNEMIALASKQAITIVETAKKEALVEKDNILVSGRDQLQQEALQIKMELQNKFAGLAILGAEQIIKRSINAEDHVALLNNLSKVMTG